MAANKRHELVPKHTKLSEKEKKELLDKYKITIKELPVIHITDHGIEGLKVVDGDVIKIVRPSFTRKQTTFYRRVTNA